MCSKQLQLKICYKRYVKFILEVIMHYMTCINRNLALLTIMSSRLVLMVPYNTPLHRSKQRWIMQIWLILTNCNELDDVEPKINEYSQVIGSRGWEWRPKKQEFLQFIFVLTYAAVYCRGSSKQACFVAFVNCVNVLLQISSLRKWFNTRFTFVIFVTFMNCMDVYLQMSCSRKWFTTRLTFVIFVSFMNC